MRVIYDKDTGRVHGIGDALEPGEGQAVAELTPAESKALAETAAAVAELAASLSAAEAAQQEAATAYAVAADGVRRDFIAADGEAQQAGGVLGFDRKKKAFITIDATPVTEPTPDEDEAAVMADPRLAAVLRVIRRELGPRAASMAAAAVRGA